jgi:hypothetical protein
MTFKGQVPIRNKIVIKVKVKVTEHHTITAYLGSGGKTPLIL